MILNITITYLVGAEDPNSVHCVCMESNLLAESHPQLCTALVGDLSLGEWGLKPWQTKVS